MTDPKPPLNTERIFVIVMWIAVALSALVCGAAGYEIGRALSHPIVVQIQAAPAAH